MDNETIKAPEQNGVQPSAEAKTTEQEAQKFIPADQHMEQVGRYKKQRDEYKAQLDEALQRIAEQTKPTKQPQELETPTEHAEQMKKLTAELEALKQRHALDEKRWEIENVLIKAGCLDAQAMMAHIDLNEVDIKKIDCDEFKKTYPYLFKAQAKVDSSGVSQGFASSSFAEQLQKRLKG